MENIEIEEFKIYYLLDENNFILDWRLDQIEGHQILLNSNQENFNLVLNEGIDIYKIINNQIIKDTSKRDSAANHENKIAAILNLKSLLNNSDYKIIKCYEAFMRQLPLPYNLEELSAQRDAWRAEINQLEEELNGL